jgi:predicted transcriptional regulator
MATDKENIINMIKDLPDDVSMEDIIEAIYVRQKIEKGLKDSEEGRIYTHEEAKELMKKWLH